MKINTNVTFSCLFPLCFLAKLNWPDGKWIKANLGQYGYYRVNYDRENWGKLAQVLKNDPTVIIIGISFTSF